MSGQNMRKNWFAFVATTRKKLSRKLKRDVTHREAMKEASVLWPKEKTKILNKLKREERRAAKETQQKQRTEDPKPKSV
jgi:hypothetical protein